MRTTFLFGIMLLFFACNNPQQKTQQDNGYRTIEGQTMGTYYRITYQDSLNRDIQSKVEKSLAELNAELSTYDSTSLISGFNQSTAIQIDVPLSARHFFWPTSIKVLKYTAAVKALLTLLWHRW